MYLGDLFIGFYDGENVVFLWLFLSGFIGDVEGDFHGVLERTSAGSLRLWFANTPPSRREANLRLPLGEAVTE